MRHSEFNLELGKMIAEGWDREEAYFDLLDRVGVILPDEPSDYKFSEEELRIFEGL